MIIERNDRRKPTRMDRIVCIMFKIIMDDSKQELKIKQQMMAAVTKMDDQCAAKALKTSDNLASTIL